MRSLKPILLVSFVYLLFLSLSVYGYNIDGDSEVIGDSEIIACDEGEMNIENSIINESKVECANITNTVMYDSRITGPSRDIEDAELEFAVISGNVLSSGKMVYDGYTYYGSFNIDNIYDGVPPSPSGSGATVPEVTKDGGSFYVEYSSGEVGYTVTMDASDVGGGSGIELLDDGEGNDNSANDGVYTSPDIDVDYSGTGERTLTIYVDDNVGNQWEVETTVFIDNEDPTGSIFISDAGGDTEIESTDERVVNLHMTADDNVGVDGCRIANEDGDTPIEDKDFTQCEELRPWVLEQLNENKTVQYQIRDVAGNIAEYTAEVELEMPELPQSSVSIPAEEWGRTDMVEFEIYYEDLFEDMDGVTYDYRIYEAGCGEFDPESSACNVTPWVNTELLSNEHTGLDLEDGVNYTIGARTYSGVVSDQGFSDEFIIDTTQPDITSLESSVESEEWTSDSVIIFNVTGESSVGTLDGFSYRASTSNEDPNDVIDASGDNATVYISGLSSGVYYFNIKSISSSGVASEVENFTIYYDNERPPIPEAEQPVASEQSGNTLTFNWSIDDSSSLSGVEGYNVQIATDSNFEYIVEDEFVTGVESYDFVPNTTDTFHFRVRARSNAGVYGLYSTDFEADFDTTPPRFLSKRPRGTVSRSNPVLHTSTDKYATCYYGTGSNPEEEFEFTGGNFHEQRLDLEDGESYEYAIRCDDRAENTNSTTVSFTVDESASPRSMSMESEDLSGFTSSMMDIGLTLSGSGGIGELPLSEFELFVEGEEYDMFSVNDMGDGEYLLSLETPLIEDTYEVELCYQNICSGNMDLDVQELRFEVSVSLEGGSTINQMDHISHSSQANHTIGLASDSEYQEFDNSASDNIMRMSNIVGQDNNFIFLVPDNTLESTLSSKDDRIDRGLFFSDNNPSFSSPISDEISLLMALDRDSIVFSGSGSVSRGNNNILVRNEGLTSDNRVNISVIVS